MCPLTTYWPHTITRSTKWASSIEAKAPTQTDAKLTHKLSNLTVSVYMYMYTPVNLYGWPDHHSDSIGFQSLLKRLGSHQVRRTCPSINRCHQSPEGTLGQPQSRTAAKPKQSLDTDPHTKHRRQAALTHILFLFEKTHTCYKTHGHNGNMPYSRRSASFTGKNSIFL